MPRFCKKPVVIEAVRYEPPMEMDDWPKGWPFPEPSRPGATSPLLTTTGELFCETLEGALHVSPGDWIIRGVKGEFYPCKDDIFRASYEIVDEGAA